MNSNASPIDPARNRGPCGSPFSTRNLAAALIATSALFGAATVTAEGARSEAAPVFRYAVAPEKNSPIALRTMPNAECVLTSSEDPKRHLKLYADDQGTARFFAHPDKESEAPLRLTLRCKAGGKAATYSVDLRASSKPSTESPAPPAEPTPQPRGRTLPALTREEAVRLTDQELLKRGYPPRPDPKAEPEAFSTWLNAFSKPVTMITPRSVSNSEVRHDYSLLQQGTETTGNWSGFEERSTAGSFGWVSAQWNVPTVTAESGLVTTTYSSTWVGLDGDGTSDLAQAGTEQDVMHILFWTFSTYRAWTEFLPQQPTESVISNLGVSPGDRFFVEVYVGNAGGGPNLQGFFGQFVVINLTTGVGGWNYTPRGTTAVGGSEAEWIMERPTVGGSLPDLANYGTASTNFGWARKPGGAYSVCCAATSINITMTNGGTTLSSVTAPDNQTASFSWKAFH